jgi:hypothetical protein
MAGFGFLKNIGTSRLTSLRPLHPKMVRGRIAFVAFGVLLYAALALAFLARAPVIERMGQCSVLVWTGSARLLVVFAI